MSPRRLYPATVFYAIRSPYSWLALEEVRQSAHRDVLRYLPFWEPGEQIAAELAQQGAAQHYRTMSKEKHLYILQDIKREAAKRGHRVAWPVDADPQWDLPGLTLVSAALDGHHWEVYDALVRARWERGADVCDEVTMAEILERAGIAFRSLADLRADHRVTAAGREVLREYWDQEVFGVPYFKVGRERFWGLDRVSDFLQILSRDPGEPVSPLEGIPTTVLEGAPLAWDTAGGCG